MSSKAIQLIQFSKLLDFNRAAFRKFDVDQKTIVLKCEDIIDEIGAKSHSIDLADKMLIDYSKEIIKISNTPLKIREVTE